MPFDWEDRFWMFYLTGLAAAITFAIVKCTGDT